MIQRRPGHSLAALALMVGLCATGSGCGLFSGSRGATSTSQRPADLSAQAIANHQAKAAPPAARQTALTANVIQPRYELFWTVEGSKMPQGSSMNGTALVGPDGTMVLGPYGTFQVANLTIEQARTTIEKQLIAYVENPRVTLTIISTALAVPTEGTPHPSVASAGAVKQVEARVESSNEEKPSDIQTVAWRPMRKSDGDPELAPLPRPLPQPTQPEFESGPYVAYAGPHRMPRHGVMPMVDAPRESNMMTLPPYVIGPPDVLQIDSLKGLVTQPVRGPHLVRPDGSIGLGVYGSVAVAGLTIDQAKEAVARAIHARLDPNVVKLEDVRDNLSLDVLAYNSKVYYVITDRVGLGEVVERLPVTGSETVLDAISQVKGLPPEVSKHRIWVARRSPGGHQEQKLPVDWIGITQRGNTETNYQILPGDRIYVQGDKLRHIDNAFGKLFAPIERILGGTLLGSQAVNSIRTGGTFGFGVIR